MRFPKPRQRQVRTKTIVMTGGLNEVVTNLELKEGELHQCLNYMEMDGPYHGYTSLSGYEAYDGKASPSSVRAIPLNDEGNDDNCLVLLEAPVFENISKYDHEVTMVGSVTIDPITYKFSPGSYRFNGIGYIQIHHITNADFNTAFNTAFNVSLNANRTYLNLSSSWNIDFQLKPNIRSAKQVILEKTDCYKCTILQDGRIEFSINDGIGVGWTHSITTTQIVGVALFSHISISCKENTMRIAVDGLPSPTEVAIPGVNQANTDLYIGTDFLQNEVYNGFLDEFRLSADYRWIQAFEPPTVRYSTYGYDYTTWDDINRELQRDTITEVPGEGAVLGLHIYGGQVYALRNAVGGASAALWRADRIYLNGTIDDSQSGWILVDDTFNPDGHLDARNWRFSGSFAGQEVMMMVDSVSIPRVYDRYTDTVTILASGTPGIDDASGIPDLQDPPRYAKKMHVFDNRWLLAYTEDDIILSSKTTPLDYSQGFGNQLIIGDAITNLQELPGQSMCVICRNSIKVLEKLEIPTSSAATPDYTFQVRNFSREAGGIENTSERFLGDILYADDRGIVSFKQSDKYGDFEAAAIDKKVNRIFLAKKLLITTSLVDLRLNQYRLYFSDNTGLIFTFLKDELKGATFVSYDRPVIHAVEGEDPNGVFEKFFGSEDGYVYQMDSGTSFNGASIPTDLKTSYYGYGSNRYWKQFMRMIFELTASRGTQFFVRAVFDYDDNSFPETQWYDPTLKGLGGTYGVDSWDEFTWGGSVVQRFINYIRGHGTNMSIELRTTNKYLDQHIVHNVIVDYQMENIQE